MTDERKRPELREARPSPSAERIEEFLRERIASTRRGSRNFLIFGIIVLVIIAGYFSYAFNVYAEVIGNPEEVAMILQARAEEELPEFTAAIEKELRARAPEAAKAIGDAIIQGIPQLRVELEKATAKKMDLVAFQLEEEGNKVLETLLKENKDMLQPFIKDAAEKDAAYALTKKFQDIFEVAIGEEFDEEVVEFFDTMSVVKEWLNRLLANKDLTDLQMREREWVVTVMLLVDESLEHTDEEIIKKEFPLPAAERE